MTAFRKHPLRALGRLLWMAGSLAAALLEYAVRVLPTRAGHRRRATARWLQRTCNRALRIFGIELDVQGRLPRSGVLVCNHLGYADILVLGALVPARFVSKAEVRRWPVFGFLAARARTIFVNRTLRADVVRANDAIADALRAGELVVLFPEGTSSDGSRVLPFMSSLLEPAAAARCPVAAAHLAFAVDDGDPAQEVCYWADMTLVPHLLNLLAHGRVQARVRCVVQPPGETSRKALARQLHREVLRLAGLNTAPERPASEISPQGDFVSETRAQPAM